MSKENLNCARVSGTCSYGDRRHSLSEPSYSLCFGRRSFIDVAFELCVASEYAIWKLRIFLGMQWNVTYQIPVSPLHGAAARSGPRLTHCRDFTITLGQKTPLDD